MILVIADDFTGAAEMAGISLAYGLRVSLCVDELVNTSADVCIISMDSRSMQKNIAVEVVNKVTLAALKIHPEWLYKKADSVLRGYVMDELQAHLSVLELQTALLIPANPSLGRTINNGCYYINNVPINKTSFGKDPEFAITSSNIKDILGSDEVQVLKTRDTIKKGINVGEARTNEDIHVWASKATTNMMLAGAGDFFEALLNRYHVKKVTQQLPEPELPYLYVSGTAFLQSRNLIGQEGKSYAALISDAVLYGGMEQQWLDKTTKIVQQTQRLIIAFEENIEVGEDGPDSLRKRMAVLVKKVIRQQQIRHLLIEGGATATAIFHVMGWSCFEPLHEWERGVVQMQVNDFCITVKPGSYKLPPAIAALFQLPADEG